MPIRLAIDYDPILDRYEATLENGTSFHFNRSQIAGKLENCLDLYRKGVIRFGAPSWRDKVPKAEERERIRRECLGLPISKVGVIKRSRVDLDELDDNDLEI